jgi:replication-associated recombination protein RarA
MQAKKMAKEKKANIEKKKADMAANFLSFSKTLKESDFDAALKLKNELIELGENSSMLDKIKISTTE